MIAEPDLDMTEGDYQRAKTMSLSKAQWHEHLEDLERQAIVNLDAKIKALSEEIARLREENRKLQLSLDKAMVIVRAKAPKIKSELDILHELERVELSHDVEYMRKLREAVILERARYIWSHRKCEDEKVAFAVAERELRAEGVIE